MTDIYTNLWNHDASMAPKSYMITVTKNRRYGPSESEEQKDVKIFATINGPNGRTVSVTKWLVKEERWEGLVKGEQPIAWLPYPEALSE